MAEIIDVRLPLEKIRRQLQELEREFDGRLKKVEREAGKPGEKLDKSMRKARTSVKQTDTQLGTMQGRMGGLTRSITRFAGAFTAAFSAAAVVRSAVQTVIDYQQANANLNATLGTTREQTRALREQQTLLGSTTKFTASEVTNAQLELGKLGQTLQQITETTPAVLNLAAATGTDLSTAASSVAEALNQFGLEASEADRVVDVMGKSFSSSALDMGRWNATMSFAAPVAKAAGIEIEQAAAAVSVLADSGISGSRAGTALRRVFDDLSKTGKPFAEALQDLADEGLNLESAFDEVGRSAQTALLILAENSDKMANLEDQYRNAQGTIQEMADKQMDTLEGKITLLTSAWDGLILSVENGEGVLSQGAGFLVERFTGALTAFTRLNDETVSLTDKAIGLKAAYFSTTEQLRKFEAHLKEVRDRIAEIANSDAATAIAAINEQLRKDLGLSVEAVEEEDNARVGIIQKMREQLKLNQEQIEGATSQSEINRLVLQREGIEARINELLSGRKNEQEPISQAEPITDLDKAWSEAMKSMDESGQGFVASFDEAFDKMIMSQAEGYQRDKDNFTKLQEYKRAQQQQTADASADLALSVADAANALFGEQSQAAKAFAIFAATIDAYAAINKTLATVPAPAGPILATAIGVRAFAQVARIRSTPEPGFYQGTEYLQRGNNPKGRDTIPVWAHEGEAIINSQRNKQAPGLAKAWNIGKLPEYINAKHVEPALRQQRAQLEAEKAAMIATAIGGSFTAHMNDRNIIKQLKIANGIGEEQIEYLKKSLSNRNPYRA